MSLGLHSYVLIALSALVGIVAALVFGYDLQVAIGLGLVYGALWLCWEVFVFR